jgi:hypothetical protein
MNRCLLLIIIALVTAASGQDKQRRIGEIDFYGYAGLDLAKVRAALPLHEGDNYPGPDEVISGLTEAVRRVTGRAPTDIAPVCCDSRGDYLIYIGLPGNSIRNMSYNPAPKGTPTSERSGACNNA